MDLVDSSQPLTLSKLREIAQERFGDMVKAVVDVEKEIMVVGASLHADEEALLMEGDSKQQNLWGINLYPDLSGDDFIEFDSMINLRPSANNNSRGIDDLATQQRIRAVVKKLIKL